MSEIGARELSGACSGHSPLLSEIAAGRKIVTIARNDSLYAGRAESSVRYEKRRLRGTKYFVPFAAEADALVVTTRDSVYLTEAPFHASRLPTIDPAQRFARVELDQPAEPIAEASLLEPLAPKPGLQICDPLISLRAQPPAGAS